MIEHTFNSLLDLSLGELLLALPDLGCHRRILVRRRIRVLVNLTERRLRGCEVVKHHGLLARDVN